MKIAHAHIRFTFALLAVMAGTHLSAGTVEVYLNFAESVKECRLNEDKVELESTTIDKEDEDKRTPKVFAYFQVITHNTFLIIDAGRNWGEASLTKKAARTELSRLEEDQKQLLRYQLTPYAQLNQFHS